MLVEFIPCPFNDHTSTWLHRGTEYVARSLTNACIRRSSFKRSVTNANPILLSNGHPEASPHDGPRINRKSAYTQPALSDTPCD
jgi:hypothetical protein